MLLLNGWLSIIIITYQTSQEWTDFLANKCHIKRDSAHQIAAQMAEQDFNTAKFESVVSEWKFNWEGCKGILQEIGLKHLDIFPFIAALRKHISERAKEEAQTDPIPAKRFRISAKEFAIDQHQQAEIESSPQKHWLCNELVRELCLDIPTAKTSDSILFTAHNMYTYLAPQFSKKLIYRDAIAYLKAKLNAKESVQIRIKRVVPNNESEPIVVINQELWYDEGKTIFELETNQFHVKIKQIYYPRVPCSISVRVGQFECTHLLYFLRLIAPLLQPIQLDLDYYDSSDIPIDVLVHFLNTQSDWIDSIVLFDHQFNWEPIYETLNKYNKLQIYGTRCPVNVPKLIQFLTSKNNNGQTKKYLLHRNWHSALDEDLSLLIEEVKKEFARAKSKSRFVVRLNLRYRLDEFTLCNEVTGEKLQLRLKNIEDGWFKYALSRFPYDEMDDNRKELDTAVMTQFFLRPSLE